MPPLIIFNDPFLKLYILFKESQVTSIYLLNIIKLTEMSLSRQQNLKLEELSKTSYLKQATDEANKLLTLN